MGAHVKALDEGVLLVPLDPRYTQVEFNLVSVQVCHVIIDRYGMAIFAVLDKSFSVPAI